MLKVLVYPFNREFEPFLKYGMYLSEWNINEISLVSLPGWGLIGDKYEYNDKIVEVKLDFEIELINCDTVWIIDSWIDISFNDYIYPKIVKALLSKKKVIISRILSIDEKDAVSKLNEADNILILDSPQSPCTNLNIVENNVPVIAIAGVSQNTNKFEIELILKHEFEEKGYNVLLIASKREANLFGDFSVPDYMLQHDLSENEKILALNHYITQLENDKKPDVIIIGVPGAITSYDEKYFKDFGMLAFEMTRAVIMDFMILSSFNALYEKEYFLNCEKIIKEQFLIPNFLHCLSYFSVDDSDLLVMGKPCYIKMDEVSVEKTVLENNYPLLFNPFDKKDMGIIVNIVITKLTSQDIIKVV